ncbi:hypothetical protein SS50377_28355 [Spironucleus salmonicida]|uniref:Uncharacterized protein n=1 Tax=Spironucleus salmonicida TaxID=348837 RepID=V6LU16_9EUKA|nr:hypothetical protein SS50377_28355 [Spironucleus salmonicida]|eukprot:EST44284.1 Hypothetical protein SS50377_15887 [Spironucleus salmonicida]
MGSGITKKIQSVITSTELKAFAEKMYKDKVPQEVYEEIVAEAKDGLTMAEFKKICTSAIAKVQAAK